MDMLIPPPGELAMGRRPPPGDFGMGIGGDHDAMILPILKPGALLH